MAGLQPHQSNLDKTLLSWCREATKVFLSAPSVRYRVLPSFSSRFNERTGGGGGKEKDFQDQLTLFQKASTALRLWRPFIFDSDSFTEFFFDLINAQVLHPKVEKVIGGCVRAGLRRRQHQQLHHGVVGRAGLPGPDPSLPAGSFRLRTGEPQDGPRPPRVRLPRGQQNAGYRPPPRSGRSVCFVFSSPVFSDVSLPTSISSLNFFFTYQ